MSVSSASDDLCPLHLEKGTRSRCIGGDWSQNEPGARVGEGMPGKPRSPLSPELPACCDHSFQRLYFPRQECPSLSHSEQSRKPIIRKECSEGGDFHFSWDNLGIYCSKSTIRERDAFFFFFLVLILCFLKCRVWVSLMI